MTTFHRILMAAAAVLLLGMYYVPLWVIDLEAPQYPEGLGLYIHVDNVVGQKETDLESINNLNHYIGMKRIEPESIPELRFMKYIVAFLSAFALLTAIVRRRWLVLVWCIVFMAAGIAGMVDFYNWEYDYGHNLNPHAAINIPGMSYQPPLIGGKQLLNFYALSMPGPGGYLMGISLLIGMMVWWMSRPSRTLSLDVTASRLKEGSTKRNDSNSVSVVLLAAFLAVSLGACSKEPQAISFGKDECAHCKMTIADQHFGAELVTKKSKTYVFDSIECLCGFLLEKTVAETDVESEWVVDYMQPGHLIPARKAWFLRSDKRPSPMGLNLSAYSTKQAYESAHASIGGDLFYFDSIRLLVAKSW